LAAELFIKSQKFLTHLNGSQIAEFAADSATERKGLNCRAHYGDAATGNKDADTKLYHPDAFSATQLQELDQESGELP
jgi:hypothetical protein